MKPLIERIRGISSITNNEQREEIYNDLKKEIKKKVTNKNIQDQYYHLLDTLYLKKDKKVNP